jgi:hypothetical protein
MKIENTRKADKSILFQIVLEFKIQDALVIVVVMKIQGTCRCRR